RALTSSPHLAVLLRPGPSPYLWKTVTNARPVREGRRAPVDNCQERASGLAGTRVRSGEVEQDLADVLGGLHLAVGRGGLGEGVAGLDQRADLAGLEPRPDVLSNLRDDPRLVLQRSGAQGGHDNTTPLGEQGTEVELALAAAEQADDDQSTVGGQRPHVGLEVLRPDDVEDDVRA